MTNKPMLSVERGLLEVCESALFRLEVFVEAEQEMPIPSMEVLLDAFRRVLAAKPAAQQQGEPSEVGMPKPARWERMSEMQGGTWWPCANKAEADQAVNCGWTVRPLYADRQPTNQRYSMHTVMIAIARSKVRITLTSNQCYALAQSLNEGLQ